MLSGGRNLFSKPGQICECTNHHQQQPSKILMNFKGGVSVNCHNAPIIISIFLSLVISTLKIEYDMFPNNRAEFFYACPSSHQKFQFNFQR